MQLDVPRAVASPAAAACVGRILPPPVSRRAGHWQRGLAKAAFEVWGFEAKPRAKCLQGTVPRGNAPKRSRAFEINTIFFECGRAIF